MLHKLYHNSNTLDILSRQKNRIDICFGLPIPKNYIIQSDHRSIAQIENPAGSIMCVDYWNYDNSSEVYRNQIVGPIKKYNTFDINIPINRYDKYYNRTALVLLKELNLDMDMPTKKFYGVMPKYLAGFESCRLKDLVGFYIVSHLQVDKNQFENAVRADDDTLKSVSKSM